MTYSRIKTTIDDFFGGKLSIFKKKPEFAKYFEKYFKKWNTKPDKLPIRIILDGKMSDDNVAVSIGIVDTVPSLILYSGDSKLANNALSELIKQAKTLNDKA